MPLWINILGINSFIAIVYLTDICNGQLFFDPSNLAPPRIIFTTMSQKRRSYIVKCCGSDSCIPRDTRTRGNDTDYEYEGEEGGKGGGAAKATTVAGAGGGATTAAAAGGGGDTTAAAGGDTTAAGGNTPAAGGGDTTAAAAAGETTAAAAAGGETTAAAAAGETTAAAAAGGETTAAAAEGETTAAPAAGETPAAAADTPAALMMAPEAQLGVNPEPKKAQRNAQRKNKVTISKKRGNHVAKNKPIDLKSQLKGAAGIRTGRMHKGGQNKNKGKPQVSMAGNKIRVNLGGQKKNKENQQGKTEKLLQFGLKK